METNSKKLLNQIDKMDENKFCMFLKIFNTNLKAKKKIFESIENMNKEIIKYAKYLSYTEIKMLQTLNENCLLLQIGYTLDKKNNCYLEAKNLDMETILLKKINQIEERRL